MLEDGYPIRTDLALESQERLKTREICGASVCRRKSVKTV